jgi:hypothetical protein
MSCKLKLDRSNIITYETANFNSSLQISKCLFGMLKFIIKVGNLFRQRDKKFKSSRMTLCTVVNSYQSFGRACCLHLQGSPKVLFLYHLREGLLGQPWRWRQQVPPKHTWVFEVFILLQYCNLPLGVCCSMFQACTVVSSARVKCPMNFFIYSLDIQPLKMSPLCSLKILSNKHLVTEHNIQEGWRPQLLCFESLKTCISNYLPTDTASYPTRLEPSLCVESKHLGYLVRRPVTCIPETSSLGHSQVIVQLVFGSFGIPTVNLMCLTLGLVMFIHSSYEHYQDDRYLQCNSLVWRNYKIYLYIGFLNISLSENCRFHVQYFNKYSTSSLSWDCWLSNQIFAGYSHLEKWP